MKGKKVRKTLIALGVVLLFAVGFMFLGMFIDIQVISKYNYTPISFTFTFLFGGALIGLLLAFRTARHLNEVQHVSQ
jgi:drug/metabolite transporter (DMT)-like permease